MFNNVEQLCLKKKTGAGEMALLEQALIAEAGLSLIAVTHQIEESRLPPKFFQMLVQKWGAELAEGP